MKTFSFIFVFVLCLFGSVTVMAQNPVATLESNGTTKVFYGINALIDSYNSSANGDKIYLSTGFFNTPPSIAKGIKITGAGHFPDSANVAKRTTILNSVQINKGADSLRLEGLHINGGIYYDGNFSINYVKVIRCRLLAGVRFYSNSANAGKNYCAFKECIIPDFDFSTYGNNLEITHCIIGDDISNCNNALFDGNILLNSGGGQIFGQVNASVIKNNIVFATTPFVNCTSNNISNNIFPSTIDFYTNSNSNNYLGIPQANIFVNQTGNAFDYTHDYHLKTPATFLGTDGTQVGLYGGPIPFKDKGLPFNPQVISKNVAIQTDANGKLQINFTVKAQAN